MKIATPEIRTLAVNAHLSGKADKHQLASIFNVDIATINRWLRDARNEGRLAPRPRGHRTAVFSPEERERLEELLKKHPNITLQEIRTHFQKECSITTIFRTVKNISISK